MAISPYYLAAPQVCPARYVCPQFRRSLPQETQKRWPAAVLAGLLLALACPASAEQVALIQVSGAIGPATSGYIKRAIDNATAQHDECLVVQLDTPGGLLDSMKQIVQAFYASPVPIVVYVAPAGATAASAGCFITLAANVAAMAPGTTIGAAHPVEMGGGQPDATMAKKLENYAASYIESIAIKRHRNAEWAVSAVRESVAITAEKALELKVINIIAANVPDLLKQLNGREADGKILHTASAQVREVPMNLGERIFQTLWTPDVMFILMLVAIYGIIAEITHPGAILPGVVGAIALILMLYMASILPVNIVGLVLILLGVGLLIADVFAQTHGVLTAGGIVSFFLGSVMLFQKAGPAFHLSLALIIPATVVTAAFFVLVIGAGLRAQFLPIRTGRESLAGKSATALTAITTESGKVFVEGSYWNAVSEAPIEQGRPVEIVAVTGLTLKVKPKT